MVFVTVVFVIVSLRLKESALDHYLHGLFCFVLLALLL
jgi:hypothetical protein